MLASAADATRCRNRVAQADAARDELQLRQTQLRRQQFEDQVRLEVADAYVALRQARAAYEAAVQSRVLQEQSVEVEQETFDVGLATNYLVIQYQSYLAQAQSTEVSAEGAYAKSEALLLDRATASTLGSESRVGIRRAQKRARITACGAKFPIQVKNSPRAVTAEARGGSTR